MKIGIVVPFSWSYWGGVVEHAEHQAAALRRRGHDVKHRDGQRPARTPHAPAASAHRPARRRCPTGSSRSAARSSCRRTARCRTSSSRRAAIARMRACSPTEHFDVLHLHEPMTPAICVAALVVRAVPDRRHAATRTATSAGCGRRCHFWGFLMDRIDARIAVSPMAAESAARWLPGDYRVIPNGVLIPERRRPGRPRPPRRLHRPARPAQGAAGACCARGRDIHRRRARGCG